ncbi:aldehyde dehydrogenase [Pollutimonas subterranea]|uniref:Aldehyde dehydrogenase n=1 Tax=Pollutimonas subterranea TaxID=2045210 RepID=A0A2N4U8I4_9BURK|nr:aldehyde dehydrogenase family protein [Pollutimonas subterranea]PLC51332.1 aldehyde dehydrogenase [Pollutimonas subterranea]
MKGKLFIGGKWLAPHSGKTIAVIDPGTGEQFDEIADGGAADIDLAVQAARRALTGEWGRFTAVERGRVLTRLGQKVLDHFDELAELESRDCGKILATARNDVKLLARYFEFYGGAADKVHGQVIPYQNNHAVRVVRQPFGVSGHIIPWNYPVQIMGRSVGAALAMGNAAVIKPAEDASLSILRLADLAAEAGFPDGAFNVVPGYGTTAGAALISHPGVNFVSFTGSPQVGTIVQQETARNHVKCVLELGGKSPQLVFGDANLDRAIPAIINGIIQNAGQTCSAGSRLLIQREIYDEVVSRVADRFSKLRTGTQDQELDCGPIINARQRDRVQRFIDDAEKSGARIAARGELAANLPANGFYVAPTFFADVPRDHILAKEEVFGPVLAAMPFSDESDAIALANDTEYGLAAGVWTENGGRQERVAQGINSGQVFINCYGAGGGVELPFGGFGKSGHGREKGFMALEEMSLTKTIVHNFDA